MSEINCPWCEAELKLSAAAESQQCPECLTSWSYEDADEIELALAA